ncbi:MAG: hypothetical protein AAF810_15585 [Cyanobacteria bacterium P01_D01_bin.36]
MKPDAEQQGFVVGALAVVLALALALALVLASADGSWGNTNRCVLGKHVAVGCRDSKGRDT